MGSVTLLFLLWVYSPVAWESYLGILSPGWYVYNSYYAEEECAVWRDEVKLQLKEKARAICLPNTPDMRPEPLAFMLGEI